MIKKINILFPFMLFACLIAMRDIVYEIYFKSKVKPEFFAFSICLTVVSVSILILIISRSTGDLFLKLRNKKILIRVGVLSFLTSIIYFVTFYMIDKIGAGLFDLVDYGLIPILTATFGIVIFKEKLLLKYVIAAILYIIGLLMISSNLSMSGMDYLFIAFLSPLATSLSDGTTKWLLDKDHGNLSSIELLVVRFLPATILLYIFISVQGSHILPQNFENIFLDLLITSLFLGFIPLWLLCVGLVTSSLTKLAVWEFIIPVLVFLGTFHLHLNEWGKFIPILGSDLYDKQFNCGSNSTS